MPWQNTSRFVKNEVNIESTEASLLTKHKLRDDPWLEKNSKDKITPDYSHLHLIMFPVCWLRACRAFYISKLALWRFEFYFILPLAASIGSQRIVTTLRTMKILFMLLESTCYFKILLGQAKRNVHFKYYKPSTH